VTVLFALLAALGNALNVMTQHIASTKESSPARGWALVVFLFRQPLWLLGWVFLLGAFAFQALALHAGQISVVQTLLVTELVFALLLRHFWLHQTISRAAWVSALVTLVGVAVFLAMAEPQGGTTTPSSLAWGTSFAVCGGASAGLTLLGSKGSPGWRCGCYAAAAALVWAFEAALIKAFTDTLAEFGLSGTFTRWPVYALAVGGAVGTILVQAALHVGPLRVSQPILIILDPVVSIFLSVHLYNEYFTDDTAALAVGALAFVVMCTGIVFVTRTTPGTMAAG
jgi:drug/metabolite transporter (DMT)-like permease